MNERGLPDQWSEPSDPAKWVYLPNAEPGWTHWRTSVMRWSEQEPQLFPRTDRLSRLLRWLRVRDRTVWREPVRIVATSDEEFRVYLDGPEIGTS